MPGRQWYVFAAVIFVAGIAFSVQHVFRSVGELGDELPQMVVPGAAELDLQEPGTYTIFHEHESIVDGRYYSTRENLSGLEIGVLSKATGEAVPVRAPSAQMNYSLGGRSGVSMLSFDIGQPGIYRISAGYPGGRDGPRVVLAVGHGFGSRLFTTILGGIGLAMLSLALPVAIVAVTFYRRRRASETPGPGVAS